MDCIARLCLALYLHKRKLKKYKTSKSPQIPNLRDKMSLLFLLTWWGVYCSILKIGREETWRNFVGFTQFTISLKTLFFQNHDFCIRRGSFSKLGWKSLRCLRKVVIIWFFFFVCVSSWCSEPFRLFGYLRDWFLLPSTQTITDKCICVIVGSPFSITLMWFYFF